MARGNFGERLKREREMREVSAGELTKATRISSRFLDALENEDWSKLPGGVFGRGFVRSIARYLGLDEESLLAEYDLARGAPSPEAVKPYESAIPRPPRWIPFAIVAGLIAVLAGLIVGGLYGYKRWTAHRAARRPAAAQTLTGPNSHQPAASTTASPTSSVTNPSANPSAEGQTSSLDLSVSASAAVHVRIIADGAKIFDQDLTEGQNLHFRAAQQFVVAASNSSAVLLELNGQAMPPLGMPGASGTIVLTDKNLGRARGTPQH